MIHCTPGGGCGPDGFETGAVVVAGATEVVEVAATATALDDGFWLKNPPGEASDGVDDVLVATATCASVVVGLLLGLCLYRSDN